FSKNCQGINGRRGRQAGVLCASSLRRGVAGVMIQQYSDGRKRAAKANRMFLHERPEVVDRQIRRGSRVWSEQGVDIDYLWHWILVNNTGFRVTQRIRNDL